VEAINKVLRHYEGYIIALSTRQMFDEDGTADCESPAIRHGTGGVAAAPAAGRVPLTRSALAGLLLLPDGESPPIGGGFSRPDNAPVVP
jgi:hypothetical protein